LGFEIICYEEIDSTNSEAWRLIDRLATDRLKIDRLSTTSANVIIAKRQTKGRGQRGHQWQSDLGGLFMSVILQPNLELAAANAHQITLWSAWGIAKKLNETGADVKLKWLNDLLIDRRKLGGILTETRIEANKIRYAVVGIGLNWTNAVPNGAIALGELPTTLSSMDELIEVVLSGVELGQTRSQNQGMTGILAEYLEMLSDRYVRQTVNGQELQGQIVDIRPTGELVVRWEGSSYDAVYQPQNFSVGY
jgi:BirA family biotin operon repressor/biotin-[acetyl-CoA-carboxylase] ligase